jgi:hypothetical protein
MSLQQYPPDHSFWFNSGERFSHTVVTAVSATTEVDSMLCADLKDSVAFEIGYSVPEVQAVFASFKDNSLLYVWAVVPSYNREVYRSIYAQEKRIIKQFGGVDFHFHVVASNGKDPRSLISDPDIDIAYVRK